MKNIILSLIGYVLFAPIAFGQNYSCVSNAEVKTYFVNTGHKLNGLRIDSVKNVNGNTIYYPFKSIRCSSSTNTIDFSVDTAGPSWLGSQILETPDHDSYINTKWNDTFLIKNGALLGDSWVVYDDSTDISFVGTVTSIDTMTIANMLDSVKTISISVMQGGNILSSDSLNGIQFSISKNNGLIKALPFYFFPFYNHQDNQFNFTYDYYVYRYGSYYNIKGAFTFDKVVYQPLSNEQVYNFNIGDVLMIKDLTSAANGFYSTEIDTITSKQIVGDELDYAAQYLLQNVYYDGGQNGLTYTHETGTRTFEYSLVYNGDTLKMPEEIGSGAVEFYDPNDTSFCFNSALYQYDAVDLSPEATYNGVIYKNGVGLIHRYYNNYPTLTTTDTQLVGMIKNGNMCGSNGLVGIKNVIEAAQLKIYPNPANDFIKIEFEDATSQNLQISLINAIGATIGNWNMKTNSLIISTHDLPCGMYFVKISDGIKNAVRKISLEK